MCRDGARSGCIAWSYCLGDAGVLGTDSSSLEGVVRLLREVGESLSLAVFTNRVTVALRDVG